MIKLRQTSTISFRSAGNYIFGIKNYIAYLAAIYIRG